MTNSKQIFGDVKEGTYHIKEILKDKNNLPIIKYTNFIDGQKVSMSRHDTYIQDGEVIAFSRIYHKIYPHTVFQKNA
tara:strand:- start:5434 stop:5664 length:231 start_codon:yes stop_codon:yes gene_type:complete